MINFNNPEPVEQGVLTDILSFKEPGAEEKSQTNTSNNTDSGQQDKEEPKESLQLELEGEQSSDNIQGTNFNELVNLLADKGIIEEAYEGFNDQEDATEEVLAKLLEHNFQKREEKVVEEFFESLSDSTRRIVELDLNSKPSEKNKNLDSYLRALVEENNIKSLDVSNEYDQEKILREWYRNKEGFTQDEVNEKITNLKEAGILDKEAKLIKPKLDLEAEKIAKGKEEEQRKLREIETKRRENLSSRLIDTFKQGKIGNIPLSKEDATSLYSVIMDDEIEVTIHNGKKVMMTPLEAYVFYNKYDKNGSLENLALATLLLTNPKKFEEVYSKQARTKETEVFIKEHKYSNQIKRGVPPLNQKSESKYSWAIPKDLK